MIRNKIFARFALAVTFCALLTLLVITSSSYAGTYSRQNVSDGKTYRMNVGDTITFRNTRQPRGAYYAFNWFPSDTSFADFEGIGANSPHLKVTATEEGTFTVLATLDYTEQWGFSDFRNYNYEDKFTIIISDPQ